MNLKLEYLKIYDSLIATINVMAKQPYTNEGARLKLDYVNKAAEVLEKYSKLS